MTSVTASWAPTRHVAVVSTVLDADAGAPAPFSGAKTVLIVDDVWITRRTAARYLTTAGYRIFEADSADEALEVVSRTGGRIDLVLTDVVMPHFDGVQFAQHLAEQWPGIPVLFMSAYSAGVLDQYGMDLTLPFIEKPFTADGLIYKVGEVIGRYARQARA